MKSLLSFRGKSRSDSPLETGVFRIQRVESELKQLGRREWWLWFSTLWVTLLSGVALFLSFNAWLVYRQWSFRRQRRQLNQHSESEDNENEISGSPSSASLSGLDSVTGMYTRASIEPHLGKEIARAKRENTPLSLATVHLEDFEQVSQRYGQAMSDLVLKEFVRRFRKAIRGSD